MTLVQASNRKNYGDYIIWVEKRLEKCGSDNESVVCFFFFIIVLVVLMLEKKKDYGNNEKWKRFNNNKKKIYHKSNLNLVD